MNIKKPTSILGVKSKVFIYPLYGLMGELLFEAFVFSAKSEHYGACRTAWAADAWPLYKNILHMKKPKI